MTVAELIVQLEKYDPNWRIFITYDSIWESASDVWDVYNDRIEEQVVIIG